MRSDAIVFCCHVVCSQAVRREVLVALVTTIKEAIGVRLSVFTLTELII